MINDLNQSLKNPTGEFVHNDANESRFATQRIDLNTIKKDESKDS